MDKIPVGILGATGMVGQKYLQLLANHPWFEVNFLASSDHSARKSYEEAVLGRWHGNSEILKRFCQFLFIVWMRLEKQKAQADSFFRP